MKNLFLVATLMTTTAFAQAPAPRPQPSTPTFSVQELNLYPTYGRAEYEAKFGSQPDTFDASRPPKLWFDSAVACVAGGSTAFKTLNNNATAPAIESFTVPSCDVPKVNIPGHKRYPAFAPNTVKNVQSVSSGFGFSPTVFGPGLQCTLADAQALKAEIGDPNLVIRELTGPQIPQFPNLANYTKIDPSSPVGYFMVGDMNAEETLINRYSNGQGIGSPGQWVKASATVYNWQPAAMGPDVTGVPAVRVPVRDLLANEKLGTVMLGTVTTPVVIRTDLAPANPAPSSGSGFTDADRAQLAEILKILKAITGQQ